MKKSTAYVLIYFAVMLIIGTLASCGSSRAEQASTEARLPKPMVIRTVNVTHDLKIEVMRVETPTQLLRLDSTITSLATGKVLHRTLITQERSVAAADSAVTTYKVVNAMANRK